MESQSTPCTQRAPVREPNFGDLRSQPQLSNGTKNTKIVVNTSSSSSQNVNEADSSEQNPECEIKKLSLKLKKSQENESKLAAQVEYFKFECRKKEHHVNNLEAEIEELKNEIEENKTGDFSQIKKLVENVENQNSTIELLEKKCADYEEYKQFLLAEVIQLGNKCDDYEEFKQASISEKEELKQKLAKETEDSLHATKVIQEKNEEIEKERNRRYNMKNRVKDLSQLNEEKDDTIKKLGKDLRKAKKVEENWRNANIKKESKIEMLKQDLNEANSEITVLNHKLKNSSEKVCLLKSERKNLNDKIQNLKVAREELKKERGVLNSKHQEDVAKLRENLEQKNIELQKQLAWNESLNLEKEELNLSFATKQEEAKKELEAERERAREAMLKAEEERKKVESVNDDIKILKEELEENTKKNELEVEEIIERNEELNQQIGELKTSFACKEEDFKNKLNDARENARKATLMAQEERGKVENIRKEMKRVQSDLEVQSNLALHFKQLVKMADKDVKEAKSTAEELRIYTNILKVEKLCLRNQLNQKSVEIRNLQEEITRKIANLAEEDAQEKRAEKTNGSTDSAVSTGASHFCLPKQNVGEIQNKPGVIFFGGTFKEKETANVTEKSKTVSETAPTLSVEPTGWCEDVAKENCNNMAEGEGNPTCNNNAIDEASDDEIVEVGPDVLVETAKKSKELYLLLLPVDYEPPCKTRRQD